MEGFYLFIQVFSANTTPFLAIKKRRKEIESKIKQRRLRAITLQGAIEQKTIDIVIVILDK